MVSSTLGFELSVVMHLVGVLKLLLSGCNYHPELLYTFVLLARKMVMHSTSATPLFTAYTGARTYEQALGWN